MVLNGFHRLMIWYPYALSAQLMEVLACRDVIYFAALQKAAQRLIVETDSQVLADMRRNLTDLRADVMSILADIRELSWSFP